MCHELRLIPHLKWCNSKVSAGIQTFDIERQTDILHSEVVAEAAGITREAVFGVLKLIARDYPEITDKLFTQIRDRVKAALLSNAEYVQKSVYPFLVACELEENGTLVKEKIPAEIVLPESVVEKMTVLGAREEERKIIAYIILNSTTNTDVRKKLNAVEFFTCDSTQLLMPLLHELSKIDPSIKSKVKDGLATLEAVKALSDVPDFLERYCFNVANTQPYVLVNFKYEDRVSAAARKELLEAFVAIMLRVLKEYLLG